jgi:hypothetical protein
MTTTKCRELLLDYLAVAAVRAEAASAENETAAKTVAIKTGNSFTCCSLIIGGAIDCQPG